jgi:hypothetical protein
MAETPYQNLYYSTRELVNRFKPSLSNTFNVFINGSFQGIGNDDINFMAYEAVLPGTSYETAQVYGDRMGRIEQYHTRRIYPNVDISFYIDQDYKVLNFFSVDTHTIFPPCLEVRWDDSAYSTGSLLVIDNSNIELAIANNPYQIKSTTDKYKFRIAARDKYPARSFSTSSIYLAKKALPSSSYWAIQDVKTEDMVFDFDSNYTKISCDPTSSFFNIYMSGLEPERYYKVLVKYVLNSGETVVVDNDSIFKIVR